MFQGLDDDCYEARLKVRDVHEADARNYYFKIKNEKGEDSYAVSLSVQGKCNSIYVTMITR